MKKLTIIFFIISFIQSCVFIRTDNSIDLGNNYRFIQDTPQTIIYHNDDEYIGSGIEIVPPIVLEYEFNDRYIIAKSQEVDEITGRKKDKLNKYWIIDKKMKGNSINPMDSISFYETLKTKNIGIDLPDRSDLHSECH